MTEPVTKRADQLVVGDRIPAEYLPVRFNKGPGEVVHVAQEQGYELGDDAHTFFAYRYPNGRHDSTTVRSEAMLKVYPADPAGHGFSREADDPTPVSGGRITPHTGGMTDGGLVDESEVAGAIDQDAEDAAAFDRGFMREHRRLDRVTGVPLCEHNDDADACQLTHGHCGKPGPHGPHGPEPVGLIVGDTADEQRDNAYAAYERDEAEYLPNCPECMGQHHAIEPCR